MTTLVERATRPERRVWQLSAVMAALAAAIAVPGLVVSPQAAVPTTGWFVLVPLFALAEVLVIHLPAERSSHSHVLREIPAVAGLAFLAPQQYVSAYVLGAGLALVLWTRVRGLKLGFNLAMLSLEAALGAVVFHAVLAGADPVGPRAWLAAAAAVLVVDLISAAAVTAAISLTDSRFDSAVLREAIRTGIPAAMVNTCVALLLVTLVVASPTALPLLGVLVALLVAGYRIHVRLARGHTRLQLLYQFVGSTSHQAELEDAVASILSEASRLMHATTAQLVVLPDGDEPGRHLTWSAGVLRIEDVDLGASRAWWSAALGGQPVLFKRGASEPAGDAPRDGLAVPLRPDGEVAGVLLVTDRTFEEETFGPEDLRVFEAVGGHTAVALDKARAVDRLRRLADERAHEAMHDPLTGLPNRRAFQQAVREAMGDESSTAVLLLDLDDFKDVNDTLGHSAGDRLLTVTGSLLAEASDGLVARLGGDEFAVLLPGLDVETALAHAATLHDVLSAPVPLLGVGLTTSASIGVTTFNGSSQSADEILAQADVAMYAAKADRSGVRDYRAEDGHSTARRLALAADLKVALADGALELYFQPQADARTGSVTGFEALLRWQHPQFGFVPPPEIVAVAHRTGLIHELTGTVLRRALEARAEWARSGHRLVVSVNVTPADVADPRLVDRVAAELRATATPPEALVVELTESDAMRDPERSLAVLTALHGLGVRLSVDDFGTGHSSLSYLDRLPVHEVKIDRSFVVRLEQVSADSTIVRATVTLAHDLGLRVVAEGVENDLTTALVAEMGCDSYQGYGLARPMPGADVLAWLAVRRSRPIALLPSEPSVPSVPPASLGRTPH
ncbi:putative bifunctional diguanylate cyclase/phosphodiesterase [Solicola sp. PLA-1-18]|uniref:putative bifunctional diguanylate cyclase/phosphodiesterase n=1 Tax=Solicola sp. PLA-1-18 TaxID=3380532 RepID=UPI003B7E4A26